MIFVLIIIAATFTDVIDEMVEYVEFEAGLPFPKFQMGYIPFQNELHSWGAFFFLLN